MPRYLKDKRRYIRGGLLTPMGPGDHPASGASEPFLTIDATTVVLTVDATVGTGRLDLAVETTHDGETWLSVPHGRFDPLTGPGRSWLVVAGVLDASRVTWQATPPRSWQFSVAGYWK